MDALPRRIIIGIGGCTNAGKTSLARGLTAELGKRGSRVALVEQDDFYLAKEKVPTLRNTQNPSILFYNYDTAEALDGVALREKVLDAAKSCDYLVVEGNQLTDWPELMELFRHCLFLTLSKEECIKRRNTRVYDPPDEPGYFEQVVWPSYEETCNNARLFDTTKLLFFDGGERLEITLATILQNIPLSTVLQDFSTLLKVQHEPIQTQSAIDFVTAPSCGAISTFIGTVRNNFEGKEVIMLEYECYQGMVYSELERLCAETRAKFPCVDRIALIHRIGVVGVAQASVIVAISSARRQGAMKATEYLVEGLKSYVPIWKKEHYSDGIEWKENKESLLTFCRERSH